MITRLSAIGDCVLTIPVAVALKSAWPDCEITWIVDCAAFKILEPHRSVDHVIRLPKGFAARPSRLLSLRSQLRTTGFDLAIDPQGLLKSAGTAWLSNAKRRIGFGPPQAREKSWWFHTDVVTPAASHLVDKHLQLLGPLGIATGLPSKWLHSNARDRDTVAALLANTGLSQGEFVIINPGAGWASRRWPPDRFGEVAFALSKQFGIRSAVVWCGDQEREMADAIESASGGTAIVLPQTSLTELIALSESAAAMLSADSGPLHIAAATNLPCIGLFGPTDPAHSGPYGSQHIVLQKSPPLTKSKDRRSDDNSSMCRISVEEVTQSVAALLGR